MKLQLLTVFSLLQLSAGNPLLVCQETVETRIGDNVVLRCHMEPEEIIQHEMVEVTKVDPAALVYSYLNGRQLADFYEPYRHRTFLNTEDLKIGVVNLKIFSVRQSDKGTYRIHISNRRITTLVTLIVGNPLLVCQETVKARIGDNVTLTCQLEPKQNIEDDEVKVTRENADVLVYARRNREQLPDQEDQYRHRTSVNTEDLKIGVLNLNINSVTQSDEGKFRIHISKWRINSTVTLNVVQRGIDVRGEGVEEPGDPPPGFLITGCLCLIFFVIVLILVKCNVLRVYVFILLLLYLVMFTLLCLYYFTDDYRPSNVTIIVTLTVAVTVAVITLGVLLILGKPKVLRFYYFIMLLLYLVMFTLLCLYYFTGGYRPSAVIIRVTLTVAVVVAIAVIVVTLVVFVLVLVKPKIFERLMVTMMTKSC